MSTNNTDQKKDTHADSSSANTSPDILENREVAAFSYFLFLAPVLLYTRRDSDFIHFHAKQASVLLCLFVFFMILPTPFTWMNLLVVVVCITGIIQANNGNTWKIPFIANFLETGISADSVWKSVTHYSHVLKRVFIHKSQEIHYPDTSSTASTKTKNEDVVKRISFLEREMCLLSHLHNSPLSDLSSEPQQEIQKIKKTLQKKFSKKIHSSPQEKYFFGLHKQQEVLVGGFSEDQYCIMSTHQDKADTIHHGKYSGKIFSYHDTKESEKYLRNILQILT